VESVLLVAVVVAALVFAWTNGFHDAANSVATSLATGALTPRIALGLASVLNVIGSLFGVAVAETLRRSLFDVLPVNHPGAGLVLAALLAAIGWNLLTWWWGMPSSSSHALVGGMAGAGIVAGVNVHWDVMWGRVLVPTLLSPVAGFFGAWLLVVLLLRSTRDAEHGPTLRLFRLAQTVSASAVALGHGLQDAQKSVAVVTIALIATGREGPEAPAPIWVRLAIALALGLGTAFGGWRVIRTVARRIVPVDPVQGFAAELVTAGALYLASGVLGAPVSSSVMIVASVTGAGSTKGLKAIHWHVVRRIALVFLLTPVAAAAAAALLYVVGALI
jgi:PiT family inorganic phosphate transporter